MTPHDATIAFYTASVLTGLGLEFLASRPASRIPTFGADLRRGAWLGLHFFAR